MHLQAAGAKLYHMLPETAKHAFLKPRFAFFPSSLVIDYLCEGENIDMCRGAERVAIVLDGVSLPGLRVQI